VVVKKVNDVFELYRRMGIKPVTSELSPREDEKFVLTFPAQLSDEEREAIDGFSRCVTSASIFRLLETVPQAEVTPSVAGHALRKICELESASSSPARQQDSFLRTAFVNSLLDIITVSKNPAVLLQALASVGSAESIPGDQVKHRDRLVEEVMLGVTEGLFPLPLLCQAVTTLATLYEEPKRGREAADRLWLSVLTQAQGIQSCEDLASVFSVLPYLVKSRGPVLRLLQEKGLELWRKLEVGHVLEIIRALTQLQYERVSPVFLRMLSGWLSLHMHTVSEAELLALTYSFYQLSYCDKAIITALEKVVKVKGCQIKEADLVSLIASFCLKFRVRSPVILEGVGQYLVEHHKTLTTHQLTSMALVFGHLDYQPQDGFKFWEVVELQLEMAFSQVAPNLLVDLLVSFLYIEKYPLNFTNKVFNPFFIDKLHSLGCEAEVAQARQQLKLFDTGMALEARTYQGPFLPKDTHYRTIHQDARVSRLAGKLLEPLADIIGDISRLGKSVVLSNLPLHPAYVVDVMIYPSRTASLAKFGLRTNNNSLNTALLILAQESYDRTGKHLLGPQAMRIRHLKLMGFKIMIVNMNTANKLMVNPSGLKNYLQKQYLEALEKSS